MGKANLATATSATTTAKFFTAEKQEHLIKLSILIIGAVLCEFNLLITINQKQFNLFVWFF